MPEHTTLITFDVELKATAHTLFAAMAFATEFIETCISHEENAVDLPFRARVIVQQGRTFIWSFQEDGDSPYDEVFRWYPNVQRYIGDEESQQTPNLGKASDR